jgi:hypothetical protein
MWWVRRFIPGIVPTMVVLIAVFLAWAILQRRWWLRIAGAALAATLMLEFAQQSLPLRSHRELGGSFAFGEEVATALTRPDHGVLLFAWPTLGLFDPDRNLPGPIWFIQDRTTALLPVEPDLRDVQKYATAFPDEPIFVMTSTPTLPVGLDPSRFERVRTFHTVLSIWEESVTDRPDESRGIDTLLVAWRFVG